MSKREKMEKWKERKRESEMWLREEERWMKESRQRYRKGGIKERGRGIVREESPSSDNSKVLRERGRR